MRIVCLDLEGVLIPEIWVALAERTNVGELRATTRDLPDYDELMRHRLSVLDAHGLGLADLRAAAADLAPLEGVASFLDALRPRAQITVLSDTFYELASVLMPSLGNPMLVCHSLRVDDRGRITGWSLRQADPKARAVAAFQALNAHIVAAGDSYNDITMLRQADAAFLFCPSEPVARAYPEFVVCRDYPTLLGHIERAWASADISADTSDASDTAAAAAAAE